ncbi:hypothetical protein ACQWG0_26355, partial [Salmonella enterica subsp. enterica serovar Infantis]
MREKRNIYSQRHAQRNHNLNKKYAVKTIIATLKKIYFPKRCTMYNWIFYPPEAQTLISQSA